MLQLEPRSGEGCNILSQEGLDRKVCYIVIVIYLPFMHKQFQIILFCSIVCRDVHRSIMKYTTKQSYFFNRNMKNVNYS